MRAPACILLILVELLQLTGMNLLNLLTIATLTAASDVVELSSATFPGYVQKNGLVLAEFFAPWCGHCKNLAPEYEKAATTLKEKNISLAKVDCTENQDLCQELDIKGFPTMLVFEEAEKTGRYEGGRKAEDIAKFMIHRSLPVVTDVADESGLDFFIKENGVVAFLPAGGDEKLSEELKTLAKKLREKTSFAQTKNEKLAKKFGIKPPQVAVFKDDDDQPATTSDLDIEHLEEFVKVESFPSFGELNAETYVNYMTSGIPVMIGFYENDDHKALLRDSLKPHLDILKGKANIALLNAKVYGRHAENVNLQADFPALVVHDTETNLKYIHPQGSPLTPESISKYAKDFSAGKLEPTVKSAPVPETQDGPVYILVGTEFDKVVKDSDKDVLVEFYAPWCGHCKRLAPIYDELGELYKDSDKVLIAKVDHVDNEVSERIEGYPTIKLYPAGKKNEPVNYRGNRDLDDLVKFIKENGAHGVDGFEQPGDDSADSKEEL